METSDPKYKHKPSEKHTLEEVLKSLQDLIRNDLVEGAIQGTTEPQPRRENTASMWEDFAPVSPGSGPVNLDAVMRSLKDLIGNELNVGELPDKLSDLTPPLPEESELSPPKIGAAATETSAATTEADNTPAPESFSLEDIPVLNEIVAPPAPPLPAPDRVREIVLRAVAKLNVEMRKSGGAGLDTKTILRLQQLIREEIEKGGER